MKIIDFNKEDFGDDDLEYGEEQKGNAPGEKHKWMQLRIAGMAVCLIIAVIAFTKVGSILQDYHAAEKLYDSTKEQYIIDNSATYTQEETMWYEQISVDLAGLQEINPDIIGWIYFENEDISYPILYSGDNVTYLRTTYEGEDATAGSIFMDGNDELDFSDLHTILYGHNMKDLSMFGKLKYYKTDPDYYEEHRYFQIFAENRIYRYEIFSFKDVAADSEIYTIYKKDAEGFSDFAKNSIFAGSYVDGGNYDANGDHVITLSTCTANDDERFVVSAVRVAEYVID